MKVKTQKVLQGPLNFVINSLLWSRHETAQRNFWAVLTLSFQGRL